MFKNKYPLFKAGRLLKTEMLNELRDYPRNFIDIIFKSYCDGIICGCEIDVKDEALMVKRGIIKHNDVIYFLDEDKEVEYKCNNKLLILKIRFLNEKTSKDFIENSTEIYLDENVELKEDEMELCRFFLREGAHLRIHYTGFEDLSTEYDTVNVIYSLHSGNDEAGLDPIILRSYGSEILRCSSIEPWDIIFGTMCIQAKETIEKEIILDYLCHRLEIENRNYSNEEMYFYLLDILKRERENTGGRNRHGRGGYKKILID